MKVIHRSDLPGRDLWQCPLTQIFTVQHSMQTVCTGSTVLGGSRDILAFSSIKSHHVLYILVALRTEYGVSTEEFETD